MESIKDLPKTMAERALWARNEFIKNPLNSQIDDELITWCFDKKDSLWYSISGNYSALSPKEKSRKEVERKEKQERFQSEQIELAEDYYKRVLYFSKIRTMVLERDKYTCQVCESVGTSKFHIHHIHKRNEDGTDCLDNLITVCPKCHRKKDGKEYNPEWKNKK